MGTADTDEPQQSKAQEETNQETTSEEHDSKTAQTRYEYHPPHEIQKKVRESLDPNNSKRTVAKRTIYGAIVGLVLASFISFINNSTMLFGAIVALGGIAGSVNGLHSALPEQIHLETNEIAVQVLPLYLVATFIGGLLLSVPIGIMAVVVTAIFSTAFTIGQIVSLGVAAAGLLMLPVVAFHSHDHFIESYDQDWEDRFERANSLSKEVDEIETDFQQYDAIHEKIEESNPHLHSTQEEADNAINAAESYLNGLKEWDELADRYDELYSDGLELGERFEQTNQILSTIEPADPKNYERHIIDEVGHATNSIESADTYINHLQQLEKRCDSLDKKSSNCAYDVEEVERFFDRVAHSDFANGTKEVQDLVQQAESLITLLQEWNDLADRYEDANTEGEALSKRFDNTKEIRAKLHQYDPAHYERHGGEKLDESRSRIKDCEEYVNNLYELSNLLESAEQRNEKTKHDIDILLKLIKKIKAVDPAVGSSTVEQLTKEAHQVEDCLSVAEEKAKLQERVASKPHHVHQRDRNELLSRISAIDVLSNTNDAQERLSRYKTVVKCLERADEVSTRLPPSVSENLNSELQEVIRSEDILNDADYERVQRLLELFSSSEQIADFLDDSNQSEEVSNGDSYLYEFENIVDRYQLETASEVDGYAAEKQLSERAEQGNEGEVAVESFSRNMLDAASILQESNNTSASVETDGSTTSKNDNETSQSDDGNNGNIIDVNGVTETVAATLRENGYLTESDLREASVNDLASIGNLNRQIAMRIKLDVGE